MLFTGCTGSGKSEILRALQNSRRTDSWPGTPAHHKGSAFGGLLQVPAIHRTISKWIVRGDHDPQSQQALWIEDESIVPLEDLLPKDFWNQMASSPLVQMDVNRAIRVERLVHEYSPADRNEFLGIMRKLWEARGQNLKIAEAAGCRWYAHTTIDILLTYYDKAYLGSIEKKDRIRSVCFVEQHRPIGVCQRTDQLCQYPNEYSHHDHEQRYQNSPNIRTAPDAAAKISPTVLDSILHSICPNPTTRNCWWAMNQKDDAAVLISEMGHTSSVPLIFMPIVDDPATFGAIASVNAISDVYAMGGEPIMAIAILGWPIWCRQVSRAVYLKASRQKCARRLAYPWQAATAMIARNPCLA